jgi:hypothetical protein
MLVKLLPDQISKYWDYIKYAIEETAPKDWVAGRLNNILESLLIDQTQAWLCCIGIEPQEIVAVLLTTVFYDTLTRSNIFRLVLLYGFDNIPQEEWESGYKTLVKYAKYKGCVEVDSFTSEKALSVVAKKFGFTTETHIYRSLSDVTL